MFSLNATFLAVTMQQALEAQQRKGSEAQSQGKRGIKGFGGHSRCERQSGRITSEMALKCETHTSCWRNDSPSDCFIDIFTPLARVLLQIAPPSRSAPASRRESVYWQRQKKSPNHPPKNHDVWRMRF